jgi:VWFA-related protein
MRKICTSTYVLPLLLVAGILSAQDNKPTMQTRPEKAEPEKATLSVNAKLVVLSVVVHDNKGKIVNGLTKDNFLLKAGGRSIRDLKPDAIHTQTIKYFDHDTDVPLTLGLLVDVSQSQRDVLEEERKGSEVFLEKTLAAGVGESPKDKGYRAPDKAFVVQFAKPIEMLQDVTEKKPRLEKALDELGSQSPTFKIDETDTNDSEGRRVHNGGTSLYDAIYLSANEVQSKEKGRKALVILTDGVDRGSKESLADAIESAQKSDTVVYAVYYKGKDQPRQNDRPGGGQRRSQFPFPGGGGGYPGGGGGYPGGGGGYPGGGGNGGGGNNPNGTGNGRTEPSHRPNVDGRQVMERICGETGGAMFEVSKKLPVDEILTEIGDELRQQYRIGFTPQGDEAKYGYHQIDLELKNADDNKKNRIQVRDGYYVSDSE